MNACTFCNANKYQSFGCYGNYMLIIPHSLTRMLVTSYANDQYLSVNDSKKKVKNCELCKMLYIERITD